jgi:AcrR family transcriptional regulator
MDQMDGFERRKEKKKDSIRRAAIELFRTYGFDKVSISDIARKAQVSHVTIYNHFGSKEELVRDVVKTAISGLVEVSRSVIESDKPFLEKLEMIVSSKVATAAQYQGELMRAMLRDSPVMQEFMESLWTQEIEGLIRELVEEGKKLGYIDKELSQDAIWFYFEIIRKGAIADTDLLGQIRVNEKLARDLNHLFLYGLVSTER